MQVRHGKGTKKKKPLWLPYLSSIKISGSEILFKYKGGKQKIKFKDIHSIMFYGSHCPLEEGFLDKCSFYKIPIVIHRRNMTRGVYITNACDTNREDVLSKQILFRQNKKKQIYIARNLLKAKFESMQWLIGTPLKSLHRMVDINKLIQVEAEHARVYWKKYYLKLDQDRNCSRRSDDKNHISQSLNAASKFVSSIVLRWLVYHHFSPFHGFLHISTEYPALTYDLFEPYRGYIDKIVFDTLMKNKNESGDKLIAITIENIKDFLDREIYVAATRQIVTFHELFHGAVLALRSYLLGNKRFIVPKPGIPKGGRPIKSGYKLYGRNAGITNFWPETKKIARKSSDLFKKMN